MGAIMVKLKGIAWNHPRGYVPLKAASREFSKLHPNVSVKWDVRSLKEFGDMPIEDLIDSYDFITIDHPYMGQADQNKLLLPLEEYISDTILRDYANQSVGPSFQSYHYNGHLYALPVDAAALVAAFRKDLFETFGLSLPQTQEELKSFYQKVPDGFSVAWPLCPTDLWCSFLTLCAQDGGRNFIQEFIINESIGSRSLDELKYHLEFLQPESINWNPIQILDKMGQEEEIIYCPYLFGYTNYARKEYSKNIVNFVNSPVNPLHDVSTILGGVGLAISSKCKYVFEAVEYLNYVANKKFQKGKYTQNGGQPGNLEAWKSKKNNHLCNNFFNDTIGTLDHAYVRPQHPGWNLFQEQGADLLHQGIQKNVMSEKLMKNLNQLYQSIAFDGKNI